MKRTSKRKKKLEGQHRN